MWHIVKNTNKEKIKELTEFLIAELNDANTSAKSWANMIDVMEKKQDPERAYVAQEWSDEHKERAGFIIKILSIIGVDVTPQRDLRRGDE
jgi:GTPase SAR1 family protein